MDELVKAVNGILNYVNLVQNSCDHHRICLEQSVKREFCKYIEDWNRKKEAEEATDVVSTQEEFNILELEEITLADNLLRKARSIREKFKIPSVDEEQNFEIGNMKTTPKNSNNNFTDGKKTGKLRKPGPIKKPKSSVSMPVMNACRTVVSEHEKYSPCILKTSRTKEHVGNGDHVFKGKSFIPKSSSDVQVSVITKTQLNSYRNLYSKPTSLHGKSVRKIENGSKSKKFTALGNSHEKPSGGNKSSKPHLIAAACESKYDRGVLERKQPTFRDFMKTWHEDRVPVIQPEFSLSLWYPFLSTVNTTRLTVNITCNSAKELKQVHQLLHKIQETVLWLDLYCLLGKEVVPYLNHFSQKQQSIAVIRSYIQSIFHPKLRRMPMLVDSLCESEL